MSLRFKLAIGSAIATAALVAAPAPSHAQTDLGALCNSLVGSGTTDLGVATVDRCLAADQPVPCTLSDTLNVLGLVRIRHGICVDLSQLGSQRTVSVRGVATVKLLPDAAAKKAAKKSAKRRR